MNNAEFDKYLIDKKLIESDGAGGYYFRTKAPVVSGIQILSSIATADGVVAAGAKSITFTLSGDFTGTVNGVNRDAGLAWVFDTMQCGGGPCPAVPYTIITGSITIDKII
jgi:hypothetical protein